MTRPGASGKIVRMANPFERKFFDMKRRRSPEEVTLAPLGGTRSQSMQRLQIGLGGVAAMVLLVGLASVIQNRVAQTDATAVPAAAPTTQPSEAPQQNDPLVSAGVVPDLPAEPSASPTQSPAILPEQGEGARETP